MSTRTTTDWDALVTELEALDAKQLPEAQASRLATRRVAAYGLPYAILEARYQRRHAQALTE